MKLRLILSGLFASGALLASNVALADIAPPPDSGTDASVKDAGPTDAGSTDGGVASKDSGVVLVPDVDSGASTTRTDAGVIATPSTEGGGCSMSEVGVGSSGLSFLILLPLLGRRRRAKTDSQ